MSDDISQKLPMRVRGGPFERGRSVTLAALAGDRPLCGCAWNACCRRGRLVLQPIRELCCRFAAGAAIGNNALNS
jgi:hypothetical protein